jgi:gamma-glutamyltranspeptidase/glutathione hydrolase
MRLVRLNGLVVAASVMAGCAAPTVDKNDGPNTGLKTFKQEVVASKGVIATNNALASAAGLQMFARGGNAFDALIAAYFALSVVEPAMVSPFGAGFVNLRTAKGESVTLDNYTVAPGEATPDLFKLVHPDDEEAQAKLGHVTIDQENELGFKSIGVPGNLKAWLWVLKNHGSRKVNLREIMAPAIDYAKNGFWLPPFGAEVIRNARPQMDQFPGWAEQFLVGDEPAKVGSRFSRPAYGLTLEALAEASPPNVAFDDQLEAAGRRFYTGDVAKNVIVYVRAHGGIISMDDMAWYWGGGLADTSNNQGLRLREPVRGTYRGYEVIAMPPTSSGGTHVVEILNILEGYDLRSKGFASPETMHLVGEAMKIAWADRDAYMGDPDFAGKDPSFNYAPPPIKSLIDKGYAKRRRAEIDPNVARWYKAGPFGDSSPTASFGPAGYELAKTTHATAIDAEGNVIAMTQTLNGFFGSGIALPGMKPGSGMLLNDTMSLFDPDPRPGYERANAIAPRKRQLSSMSPTIVLKDGKPYLAIGAPGGTKIYSTVLQGVVNIIDHGMSIQQAVEAPRIWTMMYGDLNVELGFSDKLVTALVHMGHTVTRVRLVAAGMNGVLRDPETGLLHGGACWREDGSVAGWSGGDALDLSLNYPPVWNQAR